MVFSSLTIPNYHEVWEAQDMASKFHAFIAIHNLKRGPALGGVRFWSYPDSKAALEDVLLLARAMTYKSAVANLAHGGGKAVILMPKGSFDRETIMQRFAEFINHLKGRYITAKDVGTSTQDMALIKKSTPWVTGVPQAQGGAGDPSPMTAYGVFVGIQTCVAEAYKHASLQGVSVSIQGLGGVGWELARHLIKGGAKVWATEINPERLEQAKQDLGLVPVSSEKLMSLPVQIFSPCALGQVLHTRNIPELKAKIIAGAANDQLSEEHQDAEELQKLGILYAPDFVVNAGGLIHVANDFAGGNPQTVKKKAEQIGTTLQEIFARAKQGKMTTLKAALQLAEERLR